MKIGVLADVHGNLEALEAVLAALQSESIDRLVCLGDVVGYGPDPETCIDRIRSTTDFVVAGNHDWAAAGRIGTDGFNDAARRAVEWTARRLSSEDRTYLGNLPMSLQTEGFLCFHASPDLSLEWPYLFSSSDAAAHSGEWENSIGLFGHTHLPTVFIRDGRRFRRHEELTGSAAEFVFNPEGGALVNPGGAGQPRDGNPEAAFGVLDSGRGAFKFKRTAYAVQQTQEKMSRAGLPVRLIERLAYGL